MAAGTSLDRDRDRTMPDPVALNIKVPDTLNTLRSIADFANTAVNIQRGGINLQREQQANSERVALQRFLSVPDNFQTDGSIDLEKINRSIPAIAPLTGADTISKLTTLGNAQTTARQARQALTQEQRSIVAGPLGVLGRAGVKDPNIYQQELQNLKVLNPDNPDLHRLVDAYGTVAGAMPPDELPKSAIRASEQLLKPAEARAAMAPSVGLTPTGGALTETITQPSAGGTAPRVLTTGGAIPLTLPPGTTTVDKSGRPVYLGSPPGGGSVAAGNPPGFEASAQGSAATANEDWADTVKKGQYASTHIANTQNIKRFAKGAATGVGSDRRTFISGLAGLIGMNEGEMVKTSTDLLEKNGNLSALAGGNTDLARTLAEAANPNKHMTKEAIMEAADQVISNHRLALEKQKYLAPIKALNDPGSYNKALGEWNANADPRWFQWAEMSPKERQDMKASLSPTELAEFRRKGQRLMELGILR
jgi:hypothetical protein